MKTRCRTDLVHGPWLYNLWFKRKENLHSTIYYVLFMKHIHTCCFIWSSEPSGCWRHILLISPLCIWEDMCTDLMRVALGHQWGLGESVRIIQGCPANNSCSLLLCLSAKLPGGLLGMRRVVCWEHMLCRQKRSHLVILISTNTGLDGAVFKGTEGEAVDSQVPFTNLYFIAWPPSMHFLTLPSREASSMLASIRNDTFRNNV